MTTALDFARHRLDALRAAFDAGDRGALLAAIRICANHDLPLPAWTATAYITAYDRVLNCRTDSWDDAFGRPYPKGSHIHALRKRRQLMPAIWNEVQAAIDRDPATAIDARLFERIGARLYIGKTLAETYYYAAARLLGPARRR